MASPVVRLSPIVGLFLLHLVQSLDVPITSCGGKAHKLTELGPTDRFVIQSHDLDQAGGYESGVKCRHTFKRTKKCSTIRIKCPLLDLEKSTNCKKDFLQMVGSDFGKQRFCGDYVDIDIRTISKRMGVLFKTNKRNHDFDGFKCFVWCDDNTPATQPTPPTTPSIPSSCQCGQVQRRNKIVGGTDTEANEYPWQVLMYAVNETTNSSRFCGGSLIASNYVLTAAHCVHDLTSTLGVGLILGNHAFSSVNETDAQFSAVNSITVHSNYDTATFNNDFALLELTHPVDFDESPHIRPVCLPQGKVLPTGADVTVTGWGRTSEGGTKSTILQEVTVPVVDSTTCSNSLNIGRITNDMFCAGLLQGGKDSCQGDSGGPAVSNHFSSTTYELFGVTSFGIGCARANLPGVYAKVSFVESWITAIVGQAGCPT